ncbi:MAG: hypothetical protein J6S01_10935 [Bacteroidales bacterium]|jgi:hypothetical protein|nr:hypothetical protein [Bacteroidales bacterium]MBR0320795.1 hypothetical protein [Bacteroidales bacterium]MBR1956385.1 hypothetical protein [Bacteroidales bacterium]MBR5810652.1 hypothetical protein [Bacteroidales bacterium]
MNNKIFKITYAAIIAIILVALVVFLIMQICSGVEGNIATLYTAMYVLLIIWAAIRLFSLIKEIRNM